jgi:hypothetical protein
MNQYDDNTIKKIINQYNKKRERETKQYHEEKKYNDEFMKDNNDRAKKYYLENKDKVKLRYIENKKSTQYKCLFRYYKNQSRIAEFKIKHLEKYNFLVDQGVIVEEENNNKNITDFMK